MRSLLRSSFVFMGRASQSSLKIRSSAARVPDQRSSEGEAGERGGRHLPVPVEARMHEERDVGGRGDRRERIPTTGGRQKGNEQGASEKGKPDDAQLGDGLEIEAVRVLDECADRAVVEPVVVEAASPGSEQRM